MNSANSQKIARLEVLLGRVKERGKERAPLAVAAAAPALAVAPLLEVVEVDEEDRTFTSTEIEADIDTLMADMSEVDVDELFDTDIEVLTEIVELEIDDDDDELAAHAITINTSTRPEAETLDEFAFAEAAAQSLQPSIGEAAEAVFANELEVEAPVSSRRPVSIEAATVDSAEAYEQEGAPRHTPPPESGKQVATSPSPEDKALIGAWREPGMPSDLELGQETRAASPAASAEPPLTPERVSPTLPASTYVAKIEGAPSAFTPANFGDLLDATLAL